MTTQPTSLKRTLRSWSNSLLLSLCSVLLLTLSFPNFDGFYLAFIALVPLFIVLERQSFWQAFVALELFIILFYSYFLLWIEVFHPFALPALIVYLCVIYAIPFIIYRAIRSLYRNIYDPFVLATLFTLLEYARGFGFLRFQYGIIAYTQYNFLPFIQISALTGFLGVSFLLYLSNSFIAHLLSQLEFLEKKAQTYFKSLKGIVTYLFFNRIWVLIIILALNVTYGYFRLYSDPSPPPTNLNSPDLPADTSSPPPKFFTATLIQPWFDYNITQDRLPILSQKLFRLTEDSLAQKPSPHLKNATPPSSPPLPPPSSTSPPPNVPDLIVWPESAIDVYYEHELSTFVLPQSTNPSPSTRYTQVLYEFLKDLGQRYKATFLAGGFTLEPITKLLPPPDPQPPPPQANNNNNTPPPPPRLEPVTIGYNQYNSALLIGDDGLVRDWSGKVYLVPFAEYFPFTNILEKFPFIANLLANARASQFTPYNQYKVFLHDNIPFSTLICYEDTFADLSRTFTLAGAQFLIIITNDAWSYSERSQNIHYAFSFFRAIENNRPILRVGNAGVTTLIDTRGNPHHTLPMFEEAYTTVAFTPRSNLTPYTQFGDWFIFLLSFLLFLLVASRGLFKLFHHLFKLVAALILATLAPLRKKTPHKTPQQNP